MSAQELQALEARKRDLQIEYDNLKKRQVQENKNQPRIMQKQAPLNPVPEKANVLSGNLQYFLNERDHEQHTRGFGYVAQPNLKHMHEGLNPNIAVERHVKEEIRKREYAMELERQIVERRKRDKMEKELARAASRERIHHALNAPTAMIPSPSYASPRHNRKISVLPVRQALPHQENANRNVRELFPNDKTREDDEVMALRSQLARMQQKLNEIQHKSSEYKSERQGLEAIPAHSEPVNYLEANNNFNQLAERSRFYEEDLNFKAPRVRLKFEEPDERLRLEADEAKKQQYARELQAQIAEKAARDKARKKEQDEYDLKHEMDAVKHNPFGKVGGGAPLRNAQGEVEPSLHMLRSPENVKGSNAYVNRASNSDDNVDDSKNMPALNFRQDNPFQSKEEKEARAKLETDYQLALRKQIEEKNKIKAAEAERERLEIEHEEKRLAEEQKKMKEQFEREQIKERLKREKALQENVAAASAAAAIRSSGNSGQSSQEKTVVQTKVQQIKDSISPAPVIAANPVKSTMDIDNSPRPQMPAFAAEIAPDGLYHMKQQEAQIVSKSPEAHLHRPRMPNNELLSSMSRLELEKLRQEFQRQQDAFEEKIKDVVSEKESEMFDLRERAQFAEEEREAAKTELEMIKAEIRFRKNMEDGFENFEQISEKSNKSYSNRNEYFGNDSAQSFNPVAGVKDFIDYSGGISKPSTAGTAIDLGASLIGDSQFIFPTEGSRPIRTPGAMSDANTILSNHSEITNFNFNSEETMMVSEVEDVAIRNTRRLHLLSELENRRSHGEDLDKLLGEFVERTREEDVYNPSSEDRKDVNHPSKGHQNLGKTLETETRWI